MVWVKYGLLALGRPSVRCYSTLRAWSPVCGSTLRVSHVRHCFGPVSHLPSSRITSLCWKGRVHTSFECSNKRGYMPSSRITSLLEGLEFTPPSSPRTKRGICVPGTFTNIFFLIFRLMRYTYVFFFFTLGRSFYA